MEIKVQAKILKRTSLAIGAVGLALLVLMVANEGEPGALPLALLLIATIGYASGRIKERSTKQIDRAA